MTEELALEIRNELFGGDWDAMMTDLRNRIDDKPYTFRFASDPTADLRLVERLAKTAEVAVA